VQTNVVFEHFGHETVDATAHVRQEHENMRAVIIIGEGALDRVDLPANPLNASDGPTQKIPSETVRSLTAYADFS
jgi:hypothetical protein